MGKLENELLPGMQVNAILMDVEVICCFIGDNLNQWQQEQS